MLCNQVVAGWRGVAGLAYHTSTANTSSTKRHYMRSMCHTRCIAVCEQTVSEVIEKLRDDILICIGRGGQVRKVTTTCLATMSCGLHNLTSV